MNPITTGSRVIDADGLASGSCSGDGYVPQVSGESLYDGATGVSGISVMWVGIAAMRVGMLGAVEACPGEGGLEAMDSGCPGQNLTRRLMPSLPGWRVHFIGCLCPGTGALRFTPLICTLAARLYVPALCCASCGSSPRVAAAGTASASAGGTLALAGQVWVWETSPSLWVK